MKYYGKISDPKDLVTLEKTQNLINQSTSGTEDASNKVTEWSSPTTNTHYPSEKLVKNSLDAKQDTLTAGTNITISGTTISAKDTTYSAATTSAAGLMSVDDKVKLNGIAEGATANIGTITGIKMNGASKGTSGVVDLGTIITAHQDISGKENTSNKVTSISSSSTDAQYPSAKAVYTAVNSLPKPMQFKGSLGTGGTITALPTASISTVGYTYKVITAGTYASIAAKVGDVFVCNDTPAWVLIPSGDEPSGTVTSVGITNGGGIDVSGSPITSSGSITITNAGVRSITQDSSDGHKLTINTNGSSTTITIPDNDTTYSAATTSAAGLMSATDKSKLNGIASGATAVSESTVSGWGFTKNTGTVTSVGVKVNGSTKGTVTTSGTIDLGTLATSDTNQTIKGAGTAFGANDAVDIVAGSNVTVTADTTNKKITIASSYTNTDTKVQSAASTTNVDEPILLNNGTSATTSTVLFKSGATINPSTGNLKITQINGVTVGSSPKFTDNNTTYSFAGGDGQFTVTPSGGSAQTVSIKSIIQVLTEDPTSPVVGEMWITP